MYSNFYRRVIRDRFWESDCAGRERDSWRGYVRVWNDLQLRAPFLFVLFVLAFADDAYAAQRIALVIGNESYASAPLANPVNDATAIGKALRSMGYETDVVQNADRTRMEQAIDGFSVAAGQAEYALFFYAGHGIQVDGKNYLIPVDASVNSSRDIKKLIPLTDVTEEASRAGSLGVVVIDACRDNPFAQTLNTSLGRSIAGRGLARVKVRGKLLVAYATEADTVAADGVDLHSPYTKALLKHIAAPELDVRLMFGRVHDEVVVETDGLQVPNIYGALGGKRYFLSRIKPLSESDLEFVNSKFNSLRKAIATKNLARIEQLATPSEAWNRYLDYLIANFVAIDLSLSDLESATDGNDPIVSGKLRIEQLVRANGNVVIPSEQMRSITLTSKRIGDDWSAINW